MPFSLDKKDFNFTLKPKSPGRGSKNSIGGGGGDADCAEDGEDGSYHEDEENNSYFAPAIPLPDKIDVKTGEENEEVLYVHRAKLYRFTEGEWKERGLGDVKILRHKETKKLRVVMRREQILKICLNHVLNEEVEYKRKDDKSWLFIVHDFSEGEVQVEKCTLRFKNKEIAEEFMTFIKQALIGEAVSIEVNDESTITTDKEATLKTPTPTALQPKISESDKATANILSLPYDMFIEKPPCAGCIGCDPDAYVFPKLKENEEFIDEEYALNPLVPLEMPKLTMSKNSRPLLKQSALSPIASKTDTTNITTTEASKPKENIFLGFGSNSGPEKSALNTFSFVTPSTTKPEEVKPAVPGGFVFGSATSMFGDKKPVFGQGTSIFGNLNSFSSKPNEAGTFNTSTTDKAASIFGGSLITTTSDGSSLFSGKSSFGNTANNVFSGSPNSSSNTTNENTKSIFGGASISSPNSSNSFLGSTTSSSQSGKSSGGSIFGGSVATPQVGSSIFSGGNVTANSNVSGNSIFGGVTTNSQSDGGSSKSIFGGSSANPQSSNTIGTSIFGSSNALTFGFGKNPTVQSSIFGNSNTVKTTETADSKSGTNKPMFGETKKDETITNFADLSNKAGITDFASLAAASSVGETKKDEPITNFADLSNKAGVTDFASLAASSAGSTPSFTAKPGSTGFFGLTNQNAFSNFMSPNGSNANKNETGDKQDESEANDENYDPHYEPVIELPDEVVVSTGEEEETKLFGERATLYRWDNDTKQWKERGVGELKILLHPVKKSYRLILRREQILKLVLNQRVGPEFSLKNMNNNPKSFVWAALNYAETTEGELERLAVRFKKVEIAEEFNKQIQECINNAKKEQE